jgi:TetR/AcrR family transcriptional regulator
MIDPSDERKREIFEFKKRQILKTAEEVFSERGLEGTSLRAIAKACGLSAPGIYTYYRTKEDLYGEIIARSLDELADRVKRAGSNAAGPVASLRSALMEFYVYYRDNSHQLDLGLYLFGGARPTGVTPEIDRDLNNRFKAVIDDLAMRYRQAASWPARDAASAAAAAAVHAVGLVIMRATHRLKLLGQDPDQLMRSYVDTSVAGFTDKAERRVR